MACETSLLNNIKELCKEIVLNNSTHKSILRPYLNQYVMKCFEVILKYSNSFDDEEELKPATEQLTDFNICNAIILRANDYDFDENLHFDYDRMEADIKDLRGKSWYKDQLLAKAVQFLLAVRENKLQSQKAQLNDTIFVRKKLKHKISKQNNKIQNAIFQTIPKKLETFSISTETNLLLGYHSNDDDCKDCIQTSVTSHPRRYGRNWENLGELYVPLEPRFITSNPGCSNKLHKFNSRKSSKIMEIVLPEFVFVSHLRYLLVGIQSEIFCYDETYKFHKLPNVNIPNMKIEDLNEYVQDFLVCGTCYKRFNFLKLYCRNAIFQTMASAVKDYTHLMYLFVDDQESDNLLDFKLKTRKMMKHIVSLARTLAIHPDASDPLLPTNGSKLVHYLHNRIIDSDDDTNIVLLYTFTSCCRVYFAQLQQWIFEGKLEEDFGELFIAYANIFRVKTKRHYDCAYFLRREYIPEFLKGAEEAILRCGKYMILLREIKPKHKLFQIEFPSLKPCLYYDEIHELREKCENYVRNIEELCGKPKLFQGVIEERAAEQQAKQELARKAFQVYMEKFNREEEELLKAKRESQTNLLAELKEQMKRSADEELKRKSENYKNQLECDQQVAEYEKKQLIQEIQWMNTAFKCYRKMDNHTNQQTKILKDLAESKNIDFDTSQHDSIDSTIKKLLLRGSDLCERTGNDDLANNNNDEQEEQNNNQSHDLDVRFLIADVIGTQFNGQQNDNDNNEVFKDSNGETLDNNLNGELEVTELRNDVSIDNDNNRIVISRHKSDLEINRNRTIYSNPFVEVNKSPESSKLYLDWNTERARNRQKVMESEFHLGPIQSSNQNYELTPMSISSDSSSFSENKYNLGASTSKQSERERNRQRILQNGLDFTPLNQTMKKSKTFGGAENSILEILVEETDQKSISSNNLSSMRDNFENDLDDERNETLVFETMLESSRFTLDDSASEPEVSNEPLVDPEHTRSLWELVSTPIIYNLNPDKSESIQNSINEFLKKYRNEFSVVTFTEFMNKSVLIPTSSLLGILSREILQIFITDLDILGYIEVMRNYYFLLDERFKSNCIGIFPFFDIHMQAKETFIVPTLFRTLTYEIAFDKHVEKISFNFYGDHGPGLPDSPIQLSDINFFFNVEYPLNLIFTQNSFTQYSKIFSYLMKIRHTNWILEQIYQKIKNDAKNFGKQLIRSQQYSHIHAIRHKFNHFVDCLENHVVTYAITKSWQKFNNDLESISSIEELYQKHSRYLRKIKLICLLNRESNDFQLAIANVIKVIGKFYVRINQAEWIIDDKQNCYCHPKYKHILECEKEFDECVKYVVKLGDRIVEKKYQKELSSFIDFLNYNNYYNIDS